MAPRFGRLESGKRRFDLHPISIIVSHCPSVPSTPIYMSLRTDRANAGLWLSVAEAEDTRAQLARELEAREREARARAQEETL